MKRSYVRAPLGEARTMYDAYNEEMIELAHENSDIVLVYADFAKGAAGEYFQKNHPSRIYDFGIAESNVITIAGGLAAAGKAPFTHCHTIFGVGRAYNQIRQNVAYDKLNVKMVMCNSGMLWGFIGASHQPIEDIPALRAIPHLTLISPADSVETKKATKAAYEFKGPVALRLSIAPISTIYRNEYPFELGKAVTLADGQDATIIATGPMVFESLRAVDTLAKEGIFVRLLDMHTIKPIDDEAVVKAAKETGVIITAEDSNIIGGLGGAVAEIVVKDSLAPVKMVGIKDRFGQSGTLEELKQEYGISSTHIVRAVKESLKKSKVHQ